MNHYTSLVYEKELELVNQHKALEEKQNKPESYAKKVCIKPWGYEFLAYESKKIGMWCVTIKKGHATSLHCHFKKDTLLIVLSGCAKILFIDGEVQSLSTLETLFIPKKKFHSLGSFSETTQILEIEIFSNQLNFSDKNDLLRIDDQYHRKSTGYESSVQIVQNDLDAFEYFELQKDTSIQYKDVHLNIVNNIPNKRNIISILIEGTLLCNNSVCKEGTILSPSLSYTPLDSISILTIEKHDWQEDCKVIHDMEQLKIAKTQLKKENKKIILTSGCFDIVHVGHLNTLKKAKELGDILIVCLSSDSQIQKLKGNTRPINKFEDRLNLFKTITYVDYIIPYEEKFIETEETLGSIMKLLDPDIWVKGSDYTREAIQEKHPYLRSIEILPLVENRSTTKIIEKIHGNFKSNE